MPRVPKISRSHQPDRKADLAAGRSRKELAEPDEIGEGVFVDPLPAHDKLVAEVADVGDWTTEACEPELRKYPEHFDRRTDLALLGFRN